MCKCCDNCAVPASKKKDIAVESCENGYLVREYDNCGSKVTYAVSVSDVLKQVDILLTSEPVTTSTAEVLVDVPVTNEGPTA